MHIPSPTNIVIAFEKIKVYFFISLLLINLACKDERKHVTDEGQHQLYFAIYKLLFKMIIVN